MILVNTENEFVVKGADKVYKQRVYVKPTEHYYSDDGITEYVKYGCPICENIHREAPIDVFNRFSFAKGAINCPVCGINLMWED